MRWLIPDDYFKLGCELVDDHVNWKQPVGRQTGIGKNAHDMRCLLVKTGHIGIHIRLWWRRVAVKPPVLRSEGWRLTPLFDPLFNLEEKPADFGLTELDALWK